jgi:hypothetical protein
VTDQELRRLWVQMGNYWRQFSVPDDERARAVMLEDWRPFVADLPPEAVRAAVLGLADAEWPPPPGRVRAAALRVTGLASEAPDLVTAWTEVRDQIRRVGYDRDPEWTHPAIEAAARAVGWRNLCHADESDLGTYRQFRDFYTSTATHWTALTLFPPIDAASRPPELGRG